MRATDKAVFPEGLMVSLSNHEVRLHRPVEAGIQRRMIDLETLPPDAPVTLIAEFTARPGQGDVVVVLLAGLTTDVRNEPGNVVFDGYRRVDDPHKFVVYEVYRDRAAFEAHIGADYGAVFNARLRELIVEPNSVLTFLTPIR